MTVKQHHIIYKYLSETEFKNTEEDFFLQNKVAALIKERLIPAIEALFDEQAAPGKKIKIESLKIDVGTISNIGWEDKLVAQTISVLRQKLNEVVFFNSKDEVYEITYDNHRPVINAVHPTEELINNLAAFLQSGSLAWNTTMLTAKSLLNSVIETSTDKKISVTQKDKLLYNIFYSDETLERFLLQFSDEELLNFFDKVLQFKNIHELFSLHTKQFPDDVELYKGKIAKWIAVLHHFKSEIKNNNVLTSVLKKNIIEETKTSVQLKKTNNNKEYFISNAGLVIVANFLQQLFINLGLSDKKQFFSIEKQIRAVLLTQYLVTGQNEIAEHDLMLNKILCGFPLNATLPSVFFPTDEEQKQCEELLQSVLEYWEKLKSSSPQTLCNTYILRNGKLTDETSMWQLQVENKTYDIMLSFLPWSIGIIYLPWMEKRLIVEWQS